MFTKQPTKNRTIKAAASALALSSALAGAGAIADHQHRGFQDDPTPRYGHSQGYRFVTGHEQRTQRVRVHIPVRDRGPEVLPLRRLIKQNSNLDLDRYRLAAVVTKNGRFSNGFASLRTGDRKTARYLLKGYEHTQIPAPSRANATWQLRLGPGTRVRSITAVLEPRQRHWVRRSDRAYNHFGYRHSASTSRWTGPAWSLVNGGRSVPEKRKKQLKKTRAELAQTELALKRTQEKLTQSRDRNIRLTHQRARLAEKLTQEHRSRKSGERKNERDRKNRSNRAAEHAGGTKDSEQKRSRRYGDNGGRPASDRAGHS